MKVLISDYANALSPHYQLTKQVIEKICKEAQVMIIGYEDHEFESALQEAEVLITAYLPIDQKFLKKAPHLKAISISASGYSNCDLQALHERSITLMHIVEYCSREVAEHALSLMLALNRQLKSDDTNVQKGLWQGEEGPVRTLDQASVTIYGYGRIGQITASLCHALGMKVLIVDPYAKDCHYPVVDRLAGAQSDFVINHMPLNKHTTNYFNKEFFDQMHPDAYLINVARGGSVDEDALIKALDQHQIAGCGLDVLADEDPELLHHPLLERDNVIITPHMAYYSRNSVKRLFEYCGQSAAFYLIHDERYKQSVVKGA